MRATFSLQTLGAFVAYVACAAAAFASTSDLTADLFLMLNGLLALFALSAALFSAGAYRVKAIGFLLWAGLYLAVLWAFPDSAPSSRLGDNLGAAWVPASSVRSQISRIEILEGQDDALKQLMVSRSQDQLDIQAATQEARLVLSTRLSQKNRFVSLHAATTVLVGLVGAGVAAHHYRKRLGSRGAG